MVRIKLGIDGMMCGMCEAHVNDAIRKVDGVRSVKSSHRKGCTEVSADDGVSVDDVKNAVASQGYVIVSEEITSCEKKK